MGGTSPFYSTATNTVAWNAGTVQLGRYAGLGRGMDGWIAEVVFTNAKQSTTDRQKVEGYLAHKWGLTGNLSASHPYKTDPPEVSAWATWDPATVTAVTLSGGDLVATNTGTTSANQGAHVASGSGKTTGKYYFETTLTLKNAGGNCGVGIGTTASTYTNIGGTATSGNMVYFNSGNMWTNGGSTGFTLSARATGDVVGVAVDLDNRRIWFRVAPSGQWNASGSANPATNNLGFVIPAGTMVPFNVFGGASGVAGSIHTTNFGASAFTGAVPSGFTAGWPS